MNITHVLAFHRVATAGTVTLAARMAGVSQPTLSTQIKALEKTAGRPLFKRTGRRLRLTPAGEALYAATLKLADAMDEVAAALAITRQPARGRLRVSADSAIHVVPVLGQLKQQYSAFTFTLRIDNSGAVLAQVLNEEADVGVMARQTADPRLFTTKIREDRLVLLAPVCEGGDNRTQPITGLDGRDLVLRERGSTTRDVIEARLQEHGVKPGQVFEVETREGVREAVAAGFGLGVVFASEAGGDPRLAEIAITGADLAVGEYAVCLSERRNLGLVGRFLEAARAHALDHGWLGVTPTPSRS